MRIELRPLTAVGLLFVVLLVIWSGSQLTSQFADVDGDGAGSVETIALDDGTQIWPYTSRTPSVSERTLSINLVMYGDALVTQYLFREGAVGEWAELDEERQDIAPAEEFEGNVTRLAWGAAAGATRYTYVDPPDGEARWITESYQLHDGDYLGARYHIRAYEDPSGGDWTLIQAHLEHWDWFHLRHTVHSTEAAQSYVEAAFLDRWYVEELIRERFGNDQSSDSNGWVTTVDLVFKDPTILLGVLLVGAFDAARRVRRFLDVEWRTDAGVRATARALLVVATLVGVFTSVRFGAIGVERWFDTVNPKLVVAVFYPVLVVGLPVVAYLSARKLDTVPAFVAGSLGFTIATFADYTYLGVAALPIDTFVHRAAFAVAIGLIAAGASRPARSSRVELGYVRSGVLLWLAAITLPLLQFV